MIWRMLKKEFSRRIGVLIPVFVLISLSATLLAGGARITIELVDSIGGMFEKAQIPHFIQMHAGEIVQDEIDQFSRNNPLVKSQQTLEMLNIEGRTLYFKDDERAQSSSVMDISFVAQSFIFDFLLDLNNEVFYVEKGNIAVPLYFMETSGLMPGDKIRIKDGDFEMGFTVSGYLRDAQMNPSIISSKRFMVHPDDLETLKKYTGATEYLIEFMLTDPDRAGAFTNEYITAGLPQKGPNVSGPIFQIMNAISEGIVIIIIVFVSVFLIIISLMCLRFTFTASVEEDYREIGVMKAIGLSSSIIAKMYRYKYMVLAGTACLLGYGFSILLSRLFTSHMKLFFGTAVPGLLSGIIPALAAGFVLLIIYLFCRSMHKKLKHVSAVEAVRFDSGTTSGNMRNKFKLYKKRLLNINVLLGLQDVVQHKRFYFSLLRIFFICVFIMAVPLNFANTVKSPTFSQYMGIGSSDLLFDLPISDDVAQRFETLSNDLRNDDLVEKLAHYITCQYEVYNADDGVFQSINFEVGDFKVFPIAYLSGQEPESSTDIALSSMLAGDLNVKVGDRLTMLVDGTETEIDVCGIYQDVTNGGRSSKGLLPVNSKTVIWYTIAVGLSPGADAAQIKSVYGARYPSISINDVNDYMSQSMGMLIGQVEMVSLFTILLAVALAALITAMFLKMAVAKEYGYIALMKSLGFRTLEIKAQYATRIITVLLGGVIIGVLASKYLGEALAGIVFSAIGADRVSFVINVVQIYIFIPLILIIATIIATYLSSNSIKGINASRRL